MDKTELAAFTKQAGSMSGTRLQAFYLSALVGAVNRASDAHVKAVNAQTKDIGKWLGAIALACSTPADNSEEVKKQLAILETATAELESAVQANQPEVEGE